MRGGKFLFQVQYWSFLGYVLVLNEWNEFTDDICTEYNQTCIQWVIATILP